MKKKSPLIPKPSALFRRVVHSDLSISIYIYIYISMSDVSIGRIWEVPQTESKAKEEEGRARHGTSPQVPLLGLASFSHVDHVDEDNHHLKMT